MTKMIDLSGTTVTLQQIRDQSPCKEGWEKLLSSLGGVGIPLETKVSLGDIAKSNGAEDAWWCVRCLEWNDASIRRKIIGVLLLAVNRAAVNTKDHRVHDTIAAISRWQQGDDSVDLNTAAEAARAAGAAAWAWAAAEAARAAAEAAGAAGAADAAAGAADAAAWAARAAAWEAWAAADAAWAKENDKQTQDIIAAMPPLHPWNSRPSRQR